MYTVIYATGDTHGCFQRFSTRNFPEQRSMSREDYVLVLGDFGGLWDDSPESRHWLDWLEKKPFTLLFVCGNHENYDLLYALPTEEWHGGLVRRVRENVLHLARGQVFSIEGHTFFTMGGARSHDIKDGILSPDRPDFRREKRRLDRLRAEYRVEHQSWWKEEMPSPAEYDAARKALEAHGWSVDYILTHCAPTSVAKAICPDYEADELTGFLEEVRGRARFRYWLFGHYHDNRSLDGKYILLWEQIVRVL